MTGYVLSCVVHVNIVTCILTIVVLQVFLFRPMEGWGLGYVSYAFSYVMHRKREVNQNLVYVWNVGTCSKFW